MIQALADVQTTHIGEDTSVRRVFAIRTADRKKLQEHLSKNEIKTVIHYPIPPYKQLAHKQWNNMGFPITEKINKKIISLAISAVMTEEEYKKVCQLVNAYS
jgi:dTDP-4-amino-4,6-dideoxygalactose transaminase